MILLFFGMDLYNAPGALEKKQIDEILSLKETVQQYNITLTPEKAKYIVDSNKSALNDTGRIEFGESVAKKMTLKFCSSPYVSKYNIERVIEKLLEVFYYTKNETDDTIKDDVLIDIMHKGFNGECKGSVTLLFDWVITKVIHEYNFKGLKEDDEAEHIKRKEDADAEEY